MNITTTSESELDLSKLSSYSFNKEPVLNHYEKINEMRKAFRKRKKSMESLKMRMQGSMKKESEEGPRHRCLTNHVLISNNIGNEKTPKIDFFPLNRPNRNKIGKLN